MLRVALTGGIATGKSYVRARMAAEGVPTLDADAVVHDLLARDPGVQAALAERFGASFLLGNGGVDRRKLGALVFADEAARRDLEAIVHPRVYAAIGAWMAVQEGAGASWVLVDVPLLFETGHEADFDRVIVAACPAAQQLARIMRRDRVDEAAAAARVAAQWPIGEKVARATHVVDTAGTFQQTDRQVDRIRQELDALRPPPSFSL